MAINLFLGKYQPSTQDTPLWEMYSDQFLHYHDMQSPHAPPRPDYIHWHVPVRRTSSTRRGHPLTPGTCLRLLRWRPPASRPCSHRPSPPSSHTTPLPLRPGPAIARFREGESSPHVQALQTLEGGHGGLETVAEDDEEPITPASASSKRTVQVANNITPQLTDSLGVFRSEPMSMRSSAATMSRRLHSGSVGSSGQHSTPDRASPAAVPLAADDIFSTPPSSPQMDSLASGVPVLHSTPQRPRPPSPGSGMPPEPAREPRQTLQAMRQAYLEVRKEVVAGSGVFERGPHRDHDAAKRLEECDPLFSPDSHLASDGPPFVFSPFYLTRCCPPTHSSRVARYAQRQGPL